MKMVRKGSQPKLYKDWCRKVAGTAKEDYREMPKEIRAILLGSLVKEQGGLCAYTMREIDAEVSSHVEHIKPETLCRADQQGSDLEYTNLLACYPKSGMKAGFRYGAQEKDDWWEDNGTAFISPLDANCERRFRFDLDGNITAVSNHAAAVATINILFLDHDSLTDDRKRVIQEFIYGEKGNAPLSPKMASRAAGSVCRANADGFFNEFCIAIRDALGEHLKDLKKLAKIRKYSRKK